MKKINLMLSLLVSSFVFTMEQNDFDMQRERQQNRQKEIESSTFSNENNMTIIDGITNDISGTFFITKINIDDKNNLLTVNEKFLYNNKYRYKSLSGNDISNILSEITNKLAKKGYISSFATLSSIDDETLNIEIIAGKIEDIKINTGNSLDKYKEFFMFTKNKGKVLNINDLDQATDNFNSINANNMQMSVNNGSSENSSIINISNILKDKYTISYITNNHGESNQNGIWRHGIALNIDSPLGIGDNINFSYQRVNRKNPDRSWKDVSNQLQAGYILPIGPMGYDLEKDGVLPYKRRLDIFNIGYSARFRDYSLSINFRKSIKESSFYAYNTVYDMKTSNKVFSVNLDKTIFRNQRGKLNIGVGFKRKHNDNYLETVVLQDRKITIGSANLSGTMALFGGIVKLDLEYEKSNKILGLETEKEFEKYNYDLIYYKSLNENWVYRFNLNGMYSPYSLYGSEKYSIGGVGSVGGYHTTDTILGDKAIEINNEIAYKIKMKKFGELSPYLSYGYGSVRNNYDNSKYGKGYVTGITTGLRYNSEYFDFNFGYAKAMKHSEYLNPKSQEFYFSGGVKIVF